MPKKTVKKEASKNIEKLKQDRKKNIHYEIINLPTDFNEKIKQKILSLFANIYRDETYESSSQFFRITNKRDRNYHKYHRLNHFHVESESGQQIQNLITTRIGISQEQYQSMKIVEIIDKLLNIQIGGRTNMKILLDVSDNNCGLVIYYPDLNIKIPIYFKSIRSNILIEIITFIPNSSIDTTQLDKINFSELFTERIIGSRGIEIIEGYETGASGPGAARPVVAEPATEENYGVLLNCTSFFLNKVDDLYYLTQLLR
jgi:hypothetical protein